MAKTKRIVKKGWKLPISFVFCPKLWMDGPRPRMVTPVWSICAVMASSLSVKILKTFIFLGHPNYILVDFFAILLRFWYSRMVRVKSSKKKKSRVSGKSCKAKSRCPFDKIWLSAEDWNLYCACQVISSLVQIWWIYKDWQIGIYVWHQSAI